MSDEKESQALPAGPEGMDLYPYLVTWSNLEPAICKQVNDEEWQFTFENNKSETLHQSTITSEVESVYGAGLIEDLIAECVNKRAGWSYELRFDRLEETFTAYVSTTPEVYAAGLESLNPSIALLTAYLRALKGSL